MACYRDGFTFFVFGYKYTIKYLVRKFRTLCNRDSLEVPWYCKGEDIYSSCNSDDGD
jgi:hypothetical protein